MKSHHHITANAITGAMIGVIFLLPFLGWFSYGHGLIELDWTKRFLVVGLVWGVSCGIAIGLVPVMIDSNIRKRIIIGAIVGGLSGIIFYLIGDLAFLTEDSLVASLWKTVFGGVFGAISGGITALALGIFYWTLKWMNIYGDLRNPVNQSNKLLFKDRILSSLVGLVTGMIMGGFLLVLLGQTLLALFNFIELHMILLFYLLPIVMGCFFAVYAFVKTIDKLLLQKSIDGLRSGIIFCLSFILYFGILSFMILHSAFPKPEVMKEGFWLDFVPGVVVVFTILFALFAGMAGAAYEGFFFKWRAKVRNAA